MKSTYIEKRSPINITVMDIDKSTQRESSTSAPFDDSSNKIKLVFHQPKYKPPYYFNTELLELNVAQRKEKICAFHLMLHRKIYEEQRKSLILVPWGRAISVSVKDKFNGTLLKQENTKDKEEDDGEEKKEDEIYISQSGRQTKRKLYSEDALMSIVSKKPKSPQVQNKYKPKKKLTNEEIMKRSSLFKNSPNSYVNKIFDKLVDENKKRQQEEEEMDRFHKTLEQLDEKEEEFDENDVHQFGSEKEEEENDLRRRVSPPIPFKKRRNIAKSSQQKNADGMENGEKTKRALTDTVEQLYSDKTRPNVPSQTRLSIREKKQCPICGKSFTTGSKLEAHASSCGEIEFSDDEELNVKHEKNISSISCSICDKTFLLPDDYIAHRTECMETTI